MISYLSGKVIYKGEKGVIINVAGIGYNVYTTPEILLTIEIESNISLWTYLAVRENSMDLFGFKSKAELDIFEMLISVSGIGPKGALGILSIASPETLEIAIANSDLAYLTKVSGIGRKTAEKIILELKDKLKNFDNIKNDNMRDDHDALMALVALGYGEREAREALRNLSDLKNTSTKVKEALRILGGK